MKLASAHLSALSDLARSWAPSGVAVAVTDPLAPAPPVFPEEAPAVANAVPARRREFAAGRAAARTAMEELGLPLQGIPGHRNRMPQWPKGVTGSISHDATSCIAVLARTEQYRALGVDIEPAAPLPGDLLDEICVPSERAWLDKLPAGRRFLMARALFCAKEAVYKAQFPLTRLMFGFDAIELRLDEHGPGFAARFTRPVGAIRAGSIVSGLYGSAGGHMLAFVTMGAAEGSENANFPVSAIG